MTADPATLRALADRAEAWDGKGGVERGWIEVAIAEALPHPVFGAILIRCLGSVDAALTLVPEGRLWSVGTRVKVPGYIAVLSNDGKSHVGPTAAAAIVAAALRAIAEDMERAG